MEWVYIVERCSPAEMSRPARTVICGSVFVFICFKVIIGNFLGVGSIKLLITQSKLHNLIMHVK